VNPGTLRQKAQFFQTPAHGLRCNAELIAAMPERLPFTLQSSLNGAPMGGEGCAGLARRTPGRPPAKGGRSGAYPELGEGGWPVMSASADSILFF
jgi:hypothetical protein